MEKYGDLINKRFIRQWPQWLTAFEVALILFVNGLVDGWTSGYLLKLTNENAEFHITKEQASWVASISSICYVLGGIIGAICLKYSGCKSTLYLSGIVHLIGWLCYLYKNSEEAIFAGRFLNGTAAGIVVFAWPLYIGEIADPKIRARLISFIAMHQIFGVTVASIMAKYLDIHVFAVVSLVPSVVFLCSFVFLPHSPYYLIIQNRTDDAGKSLKWYLRDVDVEPELEILEKFLSDHKSSSFLDALRDINTPINRKVFLMITFVYFGTAFSGAHTIFPYMQMILNESRVNIIEPSSVVIIASVVGILGMWVFVYTSNKFESKLLFAFSSGTISLLFLIWGCYLFTLDLGFYEYYPDLQWIPLLCIVLNRLALTQGIFSFVVTLRSELLAPNVKGIICGITSPLRSIFFFAATKSYQPLVTALSEKYVLFLYALIMALTCIYAIIFLPKTKGKSLPEIQAMLSKKYRTRKHRTEYTAVHTCADHADNVRTFQ